MCYNYNNFIKDTGDEQLVNKYKLRLGERKKLLERQADWEKFKERFSFYYTSGFEHRALPVITMEKPDEIQFYHWGLIPHFTKNMEDAKVRRKGNLNARSETIFELSSFKDYIMTQRCLIPATGFYDWHDVDKKKFPFQVMVRDDEQKDAIRDFCFGGIYSSWTDKETGEVINTFSIITTPANDMMDYIHNLKKRMPLILRREDESLWLRNDLDENEVNELMQPYPSHLMKAHTIGKMIGQTKLNRNVEEVLSEEVYEGITPSF